MSPDEALALAKAQKEAAGPGWGDTAVDMAKSAGSRFLEGVTNFASGMGNVGQNMPGEMTQSGASDPGSGIDAHGKALESFRGNAGGDLVESAAPGSTTYESKTRLGRYAGTTGSAASGLVVGPGGALRRGAMALGAGVTSEAGGELAQDYAPAWEPAARVGGMVIGGVAPDALRMTPNVVMSAAKKAARGAPDPVTLKDTKDKMFALLDKAGVKYDMFEYSGLGQRIWKSLYKAQHRTQTSQAAFAEADALTQDALRGVSPNFMDLERLSQRLGQTARDLRRQNKMTEADAYDIVRDEVDDFAVTAPMASRYPDGTALIKNYRGVVRQTALKVIKARRTDEMIEAAGDHSGGYLAGLQSEINRAMKNKQDRQLFNANDKELLRAVRDGLKPVQSLARLGARLNLGSLTSGIGMAGAPAAIAFAGGSPAALPLAVGAGIWGAGKAIQASRPGAASRRMKNAAGAMRSDNFDTILTNRKLAANRRRMRQLMTGVPAAQELNRQTEKDNGKP